MRVAKTPEPGPMRVAFGNLRGVQAGTQSARNSLSQ
jgi:hypothetical protein